MQHLHNVDNNTGLADLDLCHAALLHGFWGQISAYRNSVRYYRHHDRNPMGVAGGAARRPWLQIQQQELYTDLCGFATIFCNPNAYNPELAMMGELLKMILHVSLDDLHTFSGKSGEDEARRVALALEDDWIQKQDARYAAWHAGQVLRFARDMPPASLRAFNATAVYFASITLWVYGVLADTNQRPGDGMDEASTPIVVLDSEDMRGIPEFLQYNRGTPGLRTPVFDEGDTRRGEGVEALSDTGMVLGIARRVLRDNFPVANEPLPPLVESLTTLLRDLGSGPAGRPSRAGTEE
ncbi:putative c6 transcription factor protein [Podospora conica]|nr:putative c6 transcription factor protein [Schizothecium conicum]